ncbi:MAG: TonB-dependent receptor plug domain-containing protein, partial [Rikenellaceae bacterium]
MVRNSEMGAITGENGEFAIYNVSSGKMVLDISYIGYDVSIVNLDLRDNIKDMKVELLGSSLSMNEVVVVGKRAVGSVNAVLSRVKYSPVIANGISQQQISKTSDRDASEVVKRIPGITILGDRYVIVRGLAQRYNNVWLNGSPAPSTEADGRIFSFDILPSSQIGSVMVYKAPAPEYPADFAGGFIAIETKNMPTENSQEISISTGFNTETHFNKMRLGAGSKTDFLSFDNSKRPLSKDFPRTMRGASPSQITKLTQNGFNNDWSVKERAPLPDIRLSYAINNKFDTKGGVEIGNITSINYSNTNKSTFGMTNNRYGIYSVESDKPILVEGYLDDTYSNDVRVGAMHNWAFKIDGNNKIEFRNLFNQLSKNRLTERKGTKNIGSTAFYNNTEMLYNSRLTYTGQIAGSHKLGREHSHDIDWNASYSYANKREPDRRIITNSAGVNDQEEIDYRMKTANQSISRYFQKLDDNIFSLSVDYKKKFEKGSFNPTIKAGLYADMRDRKYTPREFTYRYYNLTLEERKEYLYLPYQEMMKNEYLGADKVYIDELSRKSDAYTADSHNISGYVGLDLPLGVFNIYVGARYEYNYVSLVSNTSMDPIKDI